MAPDTSTCTAGATGSTIDYFIVDRRTATAVLGLEVAIDGAIKAAIKADIGPTTLAKNPRFGAPATWRYERRHA